MDTQSKADQRSFMFLQSTNLHVVLAGTVIVDPVVAIKAAASHADQMAACTATLLEEEKVG